MKNINEIGFFDDHFLLESLSKLGDPLEKLNKYIDWNIFEAVIKLAFEAKIKDPSKGGRTAFKKIMLFKCLIIQSLYNISDDQLEYQIMDRVSFRRFLDLKTSDKVPDSKTFWVFREYLINNGVMSDLFLIFNEMLESSNILMNVGSIIDASFVEVPRQRNNKDENKHIKKTGKTPDDWKNKPHKLAQKDTDARWTKKRGICFFGYKNHIKIDIETKLITNFVVTDASVHDSQIIDKILTKNDIGKPIYGDSAYTGENQEKIYKIKKVIPKINEKGYKNKPLTEEQKANNKEKSRIRARVEHIFGFFQNSMNGSFTRVIGKLRNEAKICLMNLTYNIFRCVQLKKFVFAG